MPYTVEEKRIRFCTPEWSGVIALDSTGNMIRLTHRKTGMEILRFPDSDAALMLEPAVYGIPLLLPPNRIRDGRFAVRDRTFRFPVNEKTTNCFLHGLALGREFEPGPVEETEDVLRLAVTFRFDASRPEFSGFPCIFEVEIRYEMRKEGVTHTVIVRNAGMIPMPLGVGFHTAFCIPETEPVTLEIPHLPDGAWNVHPQRRLPDGNKRAWSELEKSVLSGRKKVGNAAFSCMFPLPEPERCIWIRRKYGTVCYRLDPRFLHAACWNDGGGKGFFCIEPMSWMTDAPNVPLPPEISGFRLLAPHSECGFRSVISVE